jgi:hypothetical protein
MVSLQSFKTFQNARKGLQGGEPSSLDIYWLSTVRLPPHGAQDVLSESSQCRSRRARPCRPKALMVTNDDSPAGHPTRHCIPRGTLAWPRVVVRARDYSHLWGKSRVPLFTIGNDPMKLSTSRTWALLCDGEASHISAFRVQREASGALCGELLGRKSSFVKPPRLTSQTGEACKLRRTRSPGKWRGDFQRFRTALVLSPHF